MKITHKTDKSGITDITSIQTSTAQRLGLVPSEYKIVRDNDLYQLQEHEGKSKYIQVSQITSDKDVEKQINDIVDYVRESKSNNLKINKASFIEKFVENTNQTKKQNTVTEPLDTSKMTRKERNLLGIKRNKAGEFTIQLGQLDTFNDELQEYVENPINDIHDNENDPKKLEQINQFLAEHYKDILGPYNTALTIDKFNLINGPGGGYTNPDYRLTSSTYAGAALGILNTQSQNVISSTIDNLVNIKERLGTAFDARIYDPSMFSTIDSLVQTIGNDSNKVMMPLTEWEPEWPKKVVESVNGPWDDYLRIMSDTTKKILINGYIDLETGKYDASKENYTSDDNSKDSITISHTYTDINNARQDVYDKVELTPEIAKSDPDGALKKIMTYVTENVKYDHQAIVDKSIYSLISTHNNIGKTITPNVMNAYTQFTIDNANLSASEMTTKFYEQTGMPIHFGEPYFDSMLDNTHPEIINQTPETIVNANAKTIDENMRKIAAALIDNHGECSGQSTTVEFLANGLGLRNVTTIGIQYSGEQIGHAVNEWIDINNVKHIYDASLTQSNSETLLITKDKYIENYMPKDFVLIDSPDELSINESYMLNFDGIEDNNDLSQ